MAALDAVTEHVRVCPVCDTENPPAAARCACGASLAAVDFSLKRRVSEAPVAAPPAPADDAPRPAAVICPHADCAQPNPAGRERCVYCNRPLVETPQPGAGARPLPAALCESYRVVEVFPASGAEADILLAAHAPSGEQRVVKLYRKGIQPDFRLLEILAKATGDTVVRVLEHGASEGVAYEVLEYIPGGTLQDLLRAGPLPAAEVRRIVEEIAEALNGIHAHRILHRDLKPENVLLRSKAPLELALADFGIATLAAATQHFTSGARTTKYAAPEVLTGVIDPKSDWWSLGMIALEAATGRHPFDGLNEQVMNHQLATQPIDVRSVYDDGLRMVCRGLLLRDPRRRWGADEVARWLAGDATLLPPEEGPVGAVARPYRIDTTEAGSAQELALAMAKRWDMARSDLMRGQIMSWIERELHDYNLARKLRDILEHRALTDDARLLRFLLAAAPDLPPVWRGDPVTPVTLSDAARRAENDEDGAAAWLESIFTEDVLAQFAGPSHRDLTELDVEWRRGWSRFVELWEHARAADQAWLKQPRPVAEDASAEVVLFDEVVYGSHLRLELPARRGVNPSLLLAGAGPDHVAALRAQVIAALGEMTGYCRWFETLWEETQHDPVAVFVLYQMLSYARDEAEREKRRRGDSHDARARILGAARDELRATLTSVLDAAPGDHTALDRDKVAAVLEALEAMHHACEKVAALGYTDSDTQVLRQGAEKLFSLGAAVQAALARCEEATSVNAIFLKPERLLIGGAILAFVLGLRYPWIGWPFLIAAVGWLGYRFHVSTNATRAARRHLRLLRQYAQTFLRTTSAENA